MTTKQLVFQQIKTLNGKVNVSELSKAVMENDPSSKWDHTHWGYYKTNIVSERGRYTHLFSEEVKKNLREVAAYKSDMTSKSPRTVHTKSGSLRTTGTDWPIWPTPNDEEQILLAKVLLPYVKILAPEIVALIVEDNNKNLIDWKAQFDGLGIQADFYLWQDSPVAFPGIRRHVGSGETSVFRSGPKLSKAENALLLDDNTYPKQLWSFALRGKRFGMRNPAHYSLAHILDHKDYNNRNTDELVGFETSEIKNLFAGLYTSCVNSVYVPTAFLKPTDHNSKIRKLLIQIVEKYYGKVCKPLPHNLSFNLAAIEEHWQLEKFPQPTVVGNVAAVRNFLSYRNSIINDRIKQHQTSK